MSDMLNRLRNDLRTAADPQKAVIVARFFKTGVGQYGHGDVFLGIKVPDTRAIAKKYYGLTFAEITQLLKSQIHEERLAALLILVHKFQTARESARRKIFQFYLRSTQLINNWDLVDSSADKIVGQYLLDHPENRNILTQLARSKNLWDRRIAVIATYQFIKNNQFDLTLKIAEILLTDRHDLIHKAVGWMLREVGNRSRPTEENFLQKHAHNMPRTMLRYAIEKFPPTVRRQYLTNNRS